MLLGRSAAFVLGVLPWLVRAQKATCLANSTYSWTYNQKNQSPCDVAIALGAVCAGPTFTLNPLPPTYIYLGPQLSFATPCRCSSVYYSMLAACSYCQEREWLQWTTYNANCTTVYDKVFPSPLPDNTGVPSYAYLGVPSGGTFDPTAAQAVNVQSNPDSTALPIPSSTTTNVNPTLPPLLQSPTKKTNVGAIVGGVIGGVVFIGLIVAFFVWFLTKKKRTQQPQQNHVTSYPSTEKQPYSQQSHGPSSFSQPAMTQTYTGSSSATPFSPPAQSTSTFPPPVSRLYNPNDPSTFPSMPVQDGGYTRPFSPPGSHPYPHQSSSPEPYGGQVMMHVQPLSPSFTGTSSSIQARTNYTGAPELG